MARLKRLFRHRMVAMLIGVSPAGAGCDRSEGIHAAEAAGATPARATAAPTTTSVPETTGLTPAPPPCVVELPAQAPEAQEPASICPTEPEKGPELARAEVSFPAAPGAPKISVEVARQPKELSRGLMYRTSMPAEQGMLFSWSDERVRSFWMHNTCIPLDMLFLSRDGTVVGIQEQVPVLNDRSRSIPCPAAYVLEVNAGWSRQHGVRPGMRASIE